jgi:hypothetical protein
MPTRKRCCTCKKIKLVDEFGTDNRAVGKKNARCKICERRRAQRFYAAHPEHERQRKRRERRDNPERVRQSARKSYAANRPKVCEAVRQYKMGKRLSRRFFRILAASAAIRKAANQVNRK